MPRRRSTFQRRQGFTPVDQIASIIFCFMIALVCAAGIVWMSLQ